ncbi:MAG: 50S ribosomal protein L3 [archaeon]|nr:50S ribosomal protein L3 [archaeon]
MGRVHHPRRGSLGFRPKSRARRIYPRLRHFPKTSDVKVQEFAGYKVGMTHVMMPDNRKNSVTYNQELSVPVTVIECPALKVVAIRAYSKDAYGLKAVCESWALDKESKDIGRSGVMKNAAKKTDLKKDIGMISEVRLIVHTKPRVAGVSKKTPEVFEITVLGDNVDDKLKFAEERLGKDLSVPEIFKEGDIVDVLAVTKGRGFSGPVKRYGVKLLAKKSEKGKRKPGNLGPWHPHKTSWTVAQAGNLGYNNRTELNKMIVKVGENGVSDLNMKGGWLNYGVVKSSYLLVKGSIPGVSKRLVRFRAAVRPQRCQYDEPQTGYVSLESKQGI